MANPRLFRAATGRPYKEQLFNHHPNIMTMVSREPRQIVGFDVKFDKSAFRLQSIVDNGPEANNYFTDGDMSYLDVIFPGKHIQNVRNKRDTHIIESINADLRHYISPVLREEAAAFTEVLKPCRR